jgi:hypothetical protein
VSATRLRPERTARRPGAVRLPARWQRRRAALRPMTRMPSRPREPTRGVERHLSGCSGRDRRRQAVVLGSGITEPLIHVADSLTQLTLIVIGSQQTILHKSLRDLGGGPRIKAAAQIAPSRIARIPIKTPASAVRTRVRNRNSRTGSHDTTMSRAYHLGPGRTAFQAQPQVMKKPLGRVKNHPRPIRPVKDQVRLGSRWTPPVRTCPCDCHRRYRLRGQHARRSYTG